MHKRAESRLERACGAVAAALAAMMLWGAGAAIAQPVPDPASTAAQQSQQRTQELVQDTTPVQRGDPVLTDPVPRADLPPSGGATIVLRTVVFEPASEFLSPAELDAIAAAYVGRTLDFAQIASLVRDVNDLYAQKGVVTASAILPPQTLADGALIVHLVEGRLGAVAVVGERRSADDFIFDRVRLTRGDNVVDVPTAAQDIAWFNRTHSAQLRMLLEPGAAFGLTDIALGISEPPPHVLQFTLDNEGVSSTGEIQWGVSYRAYGLAGIDDNFAMSLTGSEGSMAGTISADAPINTFGTRVSAGLTASQIKVVNGPIGQLGVIGGSQVGTLGITQPLIANTHWLLSALASGSYGTSRSDLAGMTLADTQTLRGTFGFSLSYSDERGEFVVQPQFVTASVYDAVLSTSRAIELFTGSAAAAFSFNDRIRLVARGAWQYTQAQLLPGNLLFQVGGPSTVRGYPSGGVGGDSGYYVQAELHASLSDTIEGLGVFAFTDFGEVFSTFAPRTTLHSVGLGARYNWNDRLILDLAAGFPIRAAMPDQSDVAIYARLTGRVY